MKFAHEFKECLKRENFPQKWVDSAIPYSQLKKCLKKVTKELEELGLDRNTLAELAASQGLPPPQSPHSEIINEEDNPVSLPRCDIGFHYDLSAAPGNAEQLQPRLTVSVALEDGVVVDAKLSPGTRDFLKKLATRKANLQQTNCCGRAILDAVAHEEVTGLPDVSDDKNGKRGETNDGKDNEEQIMCGEDTKRAAILSPSNPSAQIFHPHIQQVEVPLVFDCEFFNILHTDVSLLGQLQEEEKHALAGEITILGTDIEGVTKPSETRLCQTRSDLATWRELLALYVEACVFFSAREGDYGVRSYDNALQQLKWFQVEVSRRKLLPKLRCKTSQRAFTRFMGINFRLMTNLRFHEINRLAVTKILKKFDKRTALGASRPFSVAALSQRQNLLTGSVAKDLCAHIASHIVSIVPQLDDYLCPVCFAVAFWPIRLRCNHVFCSRCLVKMQRQGERLCPLCRSDVIMETGTENFDSEHAAFLRRYFPKEVEEKIRANEKERNKEIYGPGARHYKFCCIM